LASTWTDDRRRAAHLQPRYVRYLGLDFAWGEGSLTKPANRSGVVALESDGHIVAAGWTIGLDGNEGDTRRASVADSHHGLRRPHATPADVANHFPARMDLQSHPATAALAATPSPAITAPYKQREDLLDAAIYAWTAALWHQFGNERCQVLGVIADVAPVRPIASIIAPARPEQRLRQAAAA
jgi:hypothetical protein